MKLNHLPIVGGFFVKGKDMPRTEMPPEDFISRLNHPNENEDDRNKRIKKEEEIKQEKKRQLEQASNIKPSEENIFVAIIKQEVEPIFEQAAKILFESLSVWTNGFHLEVKIDDIGSFLCQIRIEAINPPSGFMGQDGPEKIEGETRLVTGVQIDINTGEINQLHQMTNRLISLKTGGRSLNLNDDDLKLKIQEIILEDARAYKK